jgi:hypothetical protein
MIVPVDLTSQEFFHNPAATVRKLRAAGPVVETRFPFVGRVWMTTTQEMASRVLKDGTLFTMRKDDGAVAVMPRFLRALTNHMLAVEEPDHTRLRGIVDEAFRRRAVLDMEPRIRAIADELAGDLFARGSPADLVTQYAQQLPLWVIYRPTPVRGPLVTTVSCLPNTERVQAVHVTTIPPNRPVPGRSRGKRRMGATRGWSWPIGPTSRRRRCR